MKKSFTLFASLLLAGTLTGYAQVEVDPEDPDAPSTDVTSFEYFAVQDNAYDPNYRAFPNAAPCYFTFSLQGETALNPETTAKLIYILNDQTIGEMDTKDSRFFYMAPEEWEGNIISGLFNCNFSDVYPGNNDGLYKLVVEEGMFKRGDALSPRAEFTFDFKKPEMKDFEHTLTPEAGATVDKLGEIIIIFPGQEYVDAASTTVGILESEDGTFHEECVWPKFGEGFMVLVFGDEDTIWPAGKYTLTVPSGVISIGNPDFNPDTQDGNMKGFTVEYNVTGFVPQKELLSDHIELVFPASFDVNLNDYVNPVNAEEGFCYFKFKAAPEIGVTSEEYPDFIQFTYSETPEFDENTQTYLMGYGPADTEHIYFTEEEGQRYLNVYIPGNTDWGYTPEQYKNTGYYKLVFPKNDFAFDGANMLGAEYIFSVTKGGSSAVDSIEAAKSFTVYTIDGRQVLRNASSLNGLGKGLYIVNGKKVAITK